MFEYVCAGTGSVLGLQVVGILCLVVATVASIAGTFMGDNYKVFLLVTVATQVLSWIFLLSALLVFSDFNGTMNAPRTMYTKMLVHGEQSGSTEAEATIFGSAFGTEVGYNDARLDPYTSYPALKYPGPIANYIDSVLVAKPRWDWAEWTFSMGFFAGACAIMWLTVAIMIAADALYQLPLKPYVFTKVMPRHTKAGKGLPEAEMG